MTGICEADVDALLETLRRRTWVIAFLVALLFVTLTVASFAVIQAHDNTLAVDAISAENAVTKAQTQQQAREFQRFLSDFVAEENYVCQVEAADAARHGLPLPRSGQCSVALPVAPSPSPVPTSTPAPSSQPRPTSAARSSSAPQPSSASSAPAPAKHGHGHHCGLLASMLGRCKG